MEMKDVISRASAAFLGAFLLVAAGMSFVGSASASDSLETSTCAKCDSPSACGPAAAGGQTCNFNSGKCTVVGGCGIVIPPGS